MNRKQEKENPAYIAEKAKNRQKSLICYANKITKGKHNGSKTKKQLISLQRYS